MHNMDDLLPGFRFYPTEEELVSFYLHNKLRATRSDLDKVIPVLDIYDHNPWDLPSFAGEFCPADSEQWFFFMPRGDREARGGRPNRLTTDGYWKATGSPGDVYSSQNTVIGRKRTMVFYVGRAPNGRKTIWKMNEYKAIEFDEASSSSSTAANPQLREELSLCRIYKKSRNVRAFDRRPPPGNEARAPTFNYRNINPIRVPERTDSSSSGGQANTNPSQSVEDDQNNSDGEPYWDSEQFNWINI